jgi:hypothetical protein
MAMFALADFSVYVAIVGRPGEAGVDAATTNLDIDFLARPRAGTRLQRSGCFAWEGAWLLPRWRCSPMALPNSSRMRSQATPCLRAEP